MNLDERNKLVEDNMKLVYGIVNRRYPSFAFDDDLIQVGMLGLIRAADTWDESRAKFSTWAYRCILDDIKLELKRRIESTSLSLDYNDTEESNTTMLDHIVGDTDVDLSPLMTYGVDLSDREMEVLGYVINGGKVTDLANEQGVSPQAISQVYRRAAYKVKKAIEEADNETHSSGR